MSDDGYAALLSAITDVVELMHPNSLSAFADVLKDAEADLGSYDRFAISENVKKSLLNLRTAWLNTDIVQHELGLMLMSASASHSRVVESQSVEFVWTGPSSNLVPTRQTSQVLIELINATQRELYLISFVAYRIPNITHALKAAIARGVQIEMLLEPSHEHGGGVDLDSIKHLTKSIPKLSVLKWVDKSGGYEKGKVHAKLAVSDGHRCFATSANLTGHGMEKNIEAGVMIVGGAIPELVSSHLKALKEVGIIVKAKKL